MIACEAFGWSLQNSEATQLWGHDVGAPPLLVPPLEDPLPDGPLERCASSFRQSAACWLAKRVGALGKGTSRNQIYQDDARRDGIKGFFELANGPRLRKG